MEQQEETSRRSRHLKHVDQTIAEFEAQILPYRLRKDNNEKDIPFTHYIQLTVSKNASDGQKVQTTEILEYKQNLGLAMKHLMDRLLKKPMTYSKILKISSPERAPDKSCCFRFPANFKLTAEHFKFDTECRQVMVGLGEILLKF